MHTHTILACPAVACAQAFVQRKAMDEALHAQRGALAVQPDNFFAYLNLGQLSLHAGKPPLEALPLLEEAMRLEPSDQSAQTAVEHVRKQIGEGAALMVEERAALKRAMKADAEEPQQQRAEPVRTGPLGVMRPESEPDSGGGYPWTDWAQYPGWST